MEIILYPFWLYFREKGKLMNHLVAFRTCHYINWPKFWEIHLFTIVSCFLFAPDGSFHKTSDKVYITGKLMEVQRKTNTMKQELFSIDMTKSRKEADAKIVVWACDVSRNNPFTDIFVLNSVTVVFLILLNYFEDLCSFTTFKIFHHKYSLRKINGGLNPSITKAPLFLCFFRMWSNRNA